MAESYATPFRPPSFGCSGIYNGSNVKFLRNPDVIIDNWLRKDDDVNAIVAYTKNKPL